MTCILKTLLGLDEIKLACILTIEYEILIDHDMMINAVSKEDQHFLWLFFVWATRKNYFDNRNNPDAVFIMFDLLFDMIIR